MCEDLLYEDIFHSLSDEFDVVIIEGGGSPAETNLWSSDIVNMAVADLADAPVALVADIDRGGAFAHLFGTWALLPPEWQRRIEGFVLNKFRGDLELLAPAPDDLETATGVPTIGVFPRIDHGLPDEEGPTVLAGSGHGPQVSIVCGPFASNLDEFVPLQQVARVSWVRTPAQLADADLIVLPGSKHVANDLVWLRDAGLADAVSQAARNGIAVLGICGGLQMLGQRIEDHDRVEGAAEGLGLLPMMTHYETSKRTTQNTVCFGPLAPPWSWLGECRISGYEIRHGVTQAPQDIQIVPDGRAFGRGNVLGLYVHGVFENPVALTAFAGAVPTTLETTCDQLADAVESHLDTAWLLNRLEQADKPIGG